MNGGHGKSAVTAILCLIIGRKSAIIRYVVSTI